MRRVALFPSARRDLDGIWSYIAERNVSAADELIGRLRQTMQMLVDQPYAGADVSFMRPGLRKWTVGRYILFYLVRPDRIEIVRVLHGARDIRRLDLI